MPGAKARVLIKEHLIDLGINPWIPPIELLSPGFLEHVRKHSGGDPEAKASEMEQEENLIALVRAVGRGW